MKARQCDARFPALLHLRRIGRAQPEDGGRNLLVQTEVAKSSLAIIGGTFTTFSSPSACLNVATRRSTNCSSLYVEPVPSLTFTVGRDLRNPCRRRDAFNDPLDRSQNALPDVFLVSA